MNAELGRTIVQRYVQFVANADNIVVKAGDRRNMEDAVRKLTMAGESR